MSIRAAAAHMSGMSAFTFPRHEPAPPAEPDGPYDVDSRVFTPEAMDEHSEYLASMAVKAQAA